MIVGAIVVAILAVLAITPWILWRLEPEKRLDVTVIDKTVPTADVR